METNLYYPTDYLDNDVMNYGYYGNKLGCWCLEAGYRRRSETAICFRLTFPGDELLLKGTALSNKLHLFVGINFAIEAFARSSFISVLDKQIAHL